jgi:hypothetical protein
MPRRRNTIKRDHPLIDDTWLFSRGTPAMDEPRPLGAQLNEVVISDMTMAWLRCQRPRNHSAISPETAAGGWSSSRVEYHDLIYRFEAPQSPMSSSTHKSYNSINSHIIQSPSYNSIHSRIIPSTVMQFNQKSCNSIESHVIQSP